MEVAPICVTVTDSSRVSEARRLASACARALGFDESDTGRVALVATEAASNLLKHAGGGTIVVGASRNGLPSGVAVDLVSIDRGPGMMDLDACLVDGYSTAGSPGTGLGAVRRLASTFDCYSRRGSGTVLLARVAPHRAGHGTTGPLVIGGLSVPYPGETACGDDWSARAAPAVTTVVVADGLGHGPAAADAAGAATAVLDRHGDASAGQLVGLMHDALRATRGAAVAVAQVQPAASRVVYCGVGNISATIVGGHQARHLVSQHGTLGRDVKRIQEFTYEWPADGVLVLHSDGVGTRWRLDDYPGLAARHPTVIAGVLHRDFARGRDDATTVVVQAQGGLH